MEQLILEFHQSQSPVTANLEAVHFHSGYEFIFVTKGEVTFRIDDAVQTAYAPAVLLFNPFENHKILTAKGDYERTVLVLNSTVLEQKISPHLIAMLKCRPVGYRSILFPKAEAMQKICRLLSELREELLLEEPFGETYVLNLIYNLLIVLFRSQPQKLHYDARMMQIQLYLDEHYAEIQSIHEVSERFFLSNAHLSRAFKAYTGYTPIDYLQNLRFFKAQSLLVDSDLRVNEISRRVGFLSSNHFIRQFKKKFGITPTDFRKQQSPQH